MPGIKLSQVVMLRVIFSLALILLIVMSYLFLKGMNRQTLLLIVFLFVVFLFSYVVLNKQLRISKAYLQQKVKALDDLNEMNVIYRNAEEVANLGSWQWNLQTNMFKCSDNLFRIYGTEPRQEEISFQRFFSFVVPEDRDRLFQNIRHAFDEKTTLIASYRIIRSDGTVRHMRAIGKTRADSDFQIMLGATQDVTELIIATEKLSLLNEELAAKNRELQQSNAELSSFNFIASHDLQEPLRKIQTFASFLEESETNLSGMGRFYLQRMQNAASRIRALIQDILSYAHSTHMGKEWGDVDLNVVLDKVRQSLDRVITEKRASIQASRLPMVQGNAFQLQQLFVQILNNAFKYHKPGMAPLISITAERVTNEHGMVAGLEAGRTYHKISFADKGIGFEQEYAGKIFGLFQRLHNGDENVGSGIGLAICKKIVQYHGGAIEARSEPDEGSTFEVYLPA